VIPEIDIWRVAYLMLKPMAMMLSWKALDAPMSWRSRAITTGLRFGGGSKMQSRSS
jgi:hypothetical protein